MDAEDNLRYEISKCRNCEACKTLTNFSCLVFPEMFALVDKERVTGETISAAELMHLISMCTFCAACPCLDIKAAIIDAKTEFMSRFGLSFKIRAVEDVERIGKVGGAFPKLTNLLFQNQLARDLIEKTVGIHRDRIIPSLPTESFPHWFRRHGKGRNPGANAKKKIAYFAGCNARYFFPEVAKATVEVFEKNGIEVYYPEQQCCGMPSLLEGDKELTLEFTRYNVARLSEAVEKGYDIVCSCPTCGYMLKRILKVGASYSPECLNVTELQDGFVKIPIGRGLLSDGQRSFMMVREKYLDVMLKDESYFSEVNPKKRIMVAENTYDSGEYLAMLNKKGKLDARLGPVSARGAYYPPCHLREQRIGKPYEGLLSLIPELSVESINGNYCCGNAGIMGFKQEFHNASIRIGSRLIAMIKAMDPEVIATDCLSCRMQFNQLTPYSVLHPIQIIKESYDNFVPERSSI